MKAEQIKMSEGAFKSMLSGSGKKNELKQVGDVFPEIVLTNAHDGSASFVINAGLWRLVCSNGMVVSDTLFSSIKIRHIGYTDDAVREAIHHVSSSVPQIVDRISDFEAIELTPDKQGVFAKAALDLKYAEKEQEKRLFYPPALLANRRNEDAGNSLWLVYNRIQENLLKGSRYGLKEKKSRYDGKTYLQPKKVRAVKNITEDIRLNKALWTLTEEMAKLKKAS